jgi:hypothetical protein
VDDNTAINLYYDAIEFLKSNLGKRIHEIAMSDAADAVNGLIDVSPVDAEKIRALQSKHASAMNIFYIVESIIADGRTVLEQEPNEEPLTDADRYINDAGWV